MKENTYQTQAIPGKMIFNIYVTYWQTFFSWSHSNHFIIVGHNQACYFFFYLHQTSSKCCDIFIFCIFHVLWQHCFACVELQNRSKRIFDFILSWIIWAACVSTSRWRSSACINLICRIQYELSMHCVKWISRFWTRLYTVMRMHENILLSATLIRTASHEAG